LNFENDFVNGFIFLVTAPGNDVTGAVEIMNMRGV